MVRIDVLTGTECRARHTYLESNGSDTETVESFVYDGSKVCIPRIRHFYGDHVAVGRVVESEVGVLDSVQIGEGAGRRHGSGDDAGPDIGYDLTIR